MKDAKNFDFGGWATKHNIRCADNRIINPGCFKDQDGAVVPLVYNHDHKDIDNVLGHALLESRDQGIYAYCSFNDTPRGQRAKEMVKHGDIRSLSIYANQLKQQGDNVIHGIIREVSLVLAGANMGAFIDTVIEHSDDHDEESIIYHPYDEDLEMYHSEENSIEHADNANDAETKPEDTPAEGEGSGKTVKEVFEAMDEAKKDVVYTLAAIISSGDKESGLTEEQKAVWNKMSEEEKQVVYYINGVVKEQADAGVKHSDVQTEENNENIKNEENNKLMKQNCFENGVEKVDATLVHSAFADIVKDAKTSGDLKHAFEIYVASCEDENLVTELRHSITNIDNFYPEVKAVNNVPVTVDRRQDWVGKVMGACHRSPFARIKSTAMDITADAARAKGYVKGNQKAEEVVVALKRTTTPVTVYKLQKLDRDDIVDITDFDVVAYMKNEMSGKLQEELARAILIGDGRSSSSNDKINPLNIRPILGDNAVYTIAKDMTQGAQETNYEFANRFIDEAILARKEYKGSGNPTLFCTEDLLTNMLLCKDTLGHRLYKTVAELATALMVKDIISVPVFENVVRTDSSSAYDYTLMGVIVNLVDYNIGADKKGQVTMFDDFSLDFNKYEYLIETRMSGALIAPYSAITFEKKSDHQDDEE